MNTHISFSNIAGIRYPIVQAPMLGVSTPQMAASVSNAGGLGSLAIGGLSPEKSRELIRQTKALTNKPFAVNFFAHDIPVPDTEQIEAMRKLLLQLAQQHDLPLRDDDLELPHFYSYKEQVNVLVEEKAQLISFTFGVPDSMCIEQLKKIGSLLMGTATCVKEAIILEKKGIDIIVAQGIEAGGHRGSFIDNEPLPQVGLFSLLSSLKGKVKPPVIAAGGICDGAGILAAMKLGAVAAQIGTLFVASDESAAIPAYKEALQQASDTDSELTRAFSGRWARGLHNAFMAEMNRAGITIPDYPIQNSLTAKLRALAQKANNKDMTNLWVGQSAKAIAKPTAEIFNELVQQYEALL